MLQIGLIDRVDEIYTKTDFGNGYIGMGFEIKEVTKQFQTCISIRRLGVFIH